MWKQVRTYMRQFPLPSALRWIAADATRKVFDGHSTPSYGQTGEDRLIESIVGSGPGFFVDVGCNEPVRDSNTFRLYKRGWHGITIDANRELVDGHRKLRKKDTQVCAALSDVETEMVFTEFADSCVSSLDADHVAEWAKQRAIVARRVVRTQTLTNVLARCNAPNRFDLLSVDVEGHDLNVLRSLDFELFRPRLVVVEMHGFDIEKPSDNEVYRHLLSNGYRMIGFAVMNGFFEDRRAA